MKFIKDMQFQKNLLIQNKMCLKKGVYTLQDNLRTYCLNGYFHKDWFPSQKYTFKSIVRALIARTFYSVIVCEDGTQFSAQAVYFSNLPHNFNRDAKFFDFHDKKIRTVCPNKRRFDLYIRNRSYFQKFFPMVDLLLLDEQNLLFEERMIDKKSVPDSEWESVFRTLFDIYSVYYKTPGIDMKSVTYQCMQLSDCQSTKCIFSTTLYRQHGDLSSDNIIYDIDRNVYLIDFDHANYYPYYYDIFFLMVNLHVIKQNSIGLNLLLQGTFDEYFKNAVNDGIFTVYDAFLLFADYFLEVCNTDGVSDEWKNKYKTLFYEILEKLRDSDGEEFKGKNFH